MSELRQIGLCVQACLDAKGQKQGPGNRAPASRRRGMIKAGA